MDAYDVFIEPSVVSHSLGCNLISPNSKHLVVAKTTLLQVFEVITSGQDSNPDLSNPAKLPHYKLKLVGLYKLQGEVTDVKPIRTVENPNLDYLLVSTTIAKVSCIRWDHSRNTILTSSLHYYEHALQNLTYENIYRSELAVSPAPNSLFCLRHNNLLVFLPFNRIDEDDDDDDDDDDAKIDDDDRAKMKKDESSPKNGKGHEELKPEVEKTEKTNGAINAASNLPLFGSSFILEASALDEKIGDIIDLQYLYNYRQPTIAILSQQKSTWAGLLPQTKDNVLFTVLSLDIVTQLPTTVLQVENLPYDLEKVIALPSPLNGSLLVGCNELIHVDSGGITRRIALNEFTADITASIKNYVDQSSLSLKLEDCSISHIANSNKLLMVLRTGEMFFISFEVDGKTIKRMSVEKIDPDVYSGIKILDPGSSTCLDNNLVFLTGRSSNSHLVELRYTNATSDNVAADNVTADSGDAIDDDEDDIYGDEETVDKKRVEDSTLEFIAHDQLLNNGPITSFTMGKYTSEKFLANLPNPSYNEVSIFATGGSGVLGHLSIMTPTVQPVIKSSLQFSQINRLWTINNKYLITSDDANQKSEIFDINQSYARLPSKHFINHQLTVAMHELNNGEFILQVTPKHIILFNNKFKRVATLDEELKEFSEADIINSVFNDEYLMVFYSTGEVVIYSVNTYNKSFSKIALPKLLSDTILTTGYITNSKLLNVVLKDINVILNKGQKRKRDEVIVSARLEVKDALDAKLKLFVLVTGDNRIVVFSRFHNEKCFQLNSVDKFTDILSLGFFDINGVDPDPFIKQVMLNDLGDSHSKDEHLTILTVGGEIYSYKMYFDGENFQFTKQLDVPITGAPFNAYAHGTSIERRMIYFTNVSGITCIMVTGVVPYMITRSRHSLVKVFKFSKIPIVSFVPFSTDKIKNGLIYLDTKKNARIVELHPAFNYDYNWPIRKVHIGETVKAVTFHEGSNTLVLSTYREIPYKCIDEEGNPIVGTKTDRPSATSFQGLIKLLSPINWSVIDTLDLSENEIGLQVKSMPLDVGSETKRFKSKKEFVLVGTGKYRLEDLACNGSYKLLEIIDIIPEPGRPETNHKFKEFTQEDTRGAVTSLCDVSGRFLVAQGQKIIVRDIKDNTAVSVAFLDTSVFVSESKSFGNLVILGDTLKSVWLAGFDAEPFRMIMLGKDLQGFDVSSADFVVKDEEIYLAVADNNRRLHILQYNPEDPLSSNGQRLLHKSSFTTNYLTTCTKSVPKHEHLSTWFDPENVPFQTIGSTVEGAMYTVFPVSEPTYRRMYILQQQLIDKEYHHCGLNPRLNRIGVSESVNSANLRAMLDFELIRKFTKLNEDRKRTLSLKVSMKNAQVDIWKDLIEFENVMNNM